MVHGLEDTGKQGRIRLEVRKEGEALRLDVTDNGRGMTREELLKLTEKLEDTDPPKTGIGLYNTQQRIKLCYGEAYGIRLESSREFGTKVRILLPACEVDG